MNILQYLYLYCSPSHNQCVLSIFSTEGVVCRQLTVSLLQPLLLTFKTICSIPITVMSLFKTFLMSMFSCIYLLNASYTKHMTVAGKFTGSILRTSLRHNAKLCKRLIMLHRNAPTSETHYSSARGNERLTEWRPRQTYTKSYDTQHWFFQNGPITRNWNSGPLNFTVPLTSNTQHQF
jgi:hypothetical protein